MSDARATLPRVALALAVLTGCGGGGDKPLPRLSGAPLLPPAGVVIDLSPSFGAGVPRPAGGVSPPPALLVAPEGRDFGSVPPEALLGPLVVIDLPPRARGRLLEVRHVEAFEEEHGALPRGAWVLLRAWAPPARHPALAVDVDESRTVLQDDAEPGFHPETVAFLARERGALGLGVAGREVCPPADGLPASLGLSTLRHLRHEDGLERLPSAGATLIAAPAPDTAMRAGPVRAFAVVPR